MLLVSSFYLTRCFFCFVFFPPFVSLLSFFFFARLSFATVYSPHDFPGVRHFFFDALLPKPAGFFLKVVDHMLFLGVFFFSPPLRYILIPPQAR